jgi:hypothetical protein
MAEPVQAPAMQPVNLSLRLAISLLRHRALRKAETISSANLMPTMQSSEGEGEIKGEEEG